MQEEKKTETNVLYSDLKKEAMELITSKKLPKTLLYHGGSAYCRNVENTLSGLIRMVDVMVLKSNKSDYEKKEAVRHKDKIQQILSALKNPENCDIDVNVWRETKGRFSNFQI